MYVLNRRSICLQVKMISDCLTKRGILLNENLVVDRVENVQGSLEFFQINHIPSPIIVIYVKILK